MLKKLQMQVSLANRRKKLALAVSYINNHDTIIDIGVDPHIEYEGTDYFEKWYTGSNDLVCLGLDGDYTKFLQAYPKARLVTFDGFNFPRFDKKFDFGFCNAVIEHVGDYDKQLYWLKEISKITKRLFITTPNRHCPFEAHTSTLFYHWMPIKWRNRIYKALHKNQNLWLLSGRQLKSLLTEAGFDVERVVKNRFLFMTIDYVVIAKSRSQESTTT